MLVLSSSLDREVQAHKHFTGATNIYWLNELMRYVRSEGLLNNFRLYPMVARTNYGTGTTVRGLGKLTSNDMTLVNGPSWGASGIAFASASSQYGTIADFLGSETLTVWHRATVTDNPTAAQIFLSKFDFGADNRSWFVGQQGAVAGDPLFVARSSDGSSATAEQYSATKTGLGADNSFVAQWIAGAGRNLWVNKSAQSLSLLAGSAQTSVFDSGVNITINSNLNSGVASTFADQTAHATAFLTGSVTTTQRETITDLINAL